MGECSTGTTLRGCVHSRQSKHLHTGANQQVALGINSVLLCTPSPLHLLYLSSYLRSLNHIDHDFTSFFQSNYCSSLHVGSKRKSEEKKKIRISTNHQYFVTISVKQQHIMNPKNKKKKT